MVLKEKPSPFPGILQNILYIKKTAEQNLSAVFSCGKKEAEAGRPFPFPGIKKLRAEKSASQFYGISQYLLSVKVI